MGGEEYGLCALDVEGVEAGEGADGEVKEVRVRPEDVVEARRVEGQGRREMVVAPGFGGGGEEVDFGAGVAVVEVGEDDVEGVEKGVWGVGVHGGRAGLHDYLVTATIVLLGYIQWS